MPTTGLALAPSRTEQITDDQLIGSVREGDDIAFERLYERYCRRVSSYVNGMVKDHARAEDVTQEVFIAALRRMRATDQPIAFRPWIYEIARNACIDHFRRTKRATEVSLSADESGGESEAYRKATASVGPEQVVDARHRFDSLRWAFAELSAPHHDILVMRELEGRSYKEIGDSLELSRAGVESTLFRARKRLASEYDELVTGRRCSEVQQRIATGDTGASVGLRESRRLVGHLAHCHQCRRAARAGGRDDLIVAAARHAEARGLRRGGGAAARMRAGVAGVWAWPGLLARFPGLGAAGAHTTVESLVTVWTRVAATVMAVGAIGVGAGVSTHVVPDLGLLGGGGHGAHASGSPDAAGAAAVLGTGRSAISQLVNSSGALWSLTGRGVSGGEGPYGVLAPGSAADPSAAGGIGFADGGVSGASRSDRRPGSDDGFAGRGDTGPGSGNGSGPGTGPAAGAASGSRASLPPVTAPGATVPTGGAPSAAPSGTPAPPSGGGSGTGRPPVPDPSLPGATPPAAPAASAPPAPDAPPASVPTAPTTVQAPAGGSLPDTGAAARSVGSIRGATG